MTEVFLRLPDWSERLLDAVERHGSLPSAWGVSDCFCFPADCIEALTGQDVRGDVRYTTAAGGARAAKKRGFSDHIAGFRSLFPEAPLAHARRGDLLVFDQPAGPTVGVIIAENAFARPEIGALGFVRIPVLSGRFALRVG